MAEQNDDETDQGSAQGDEAARRLRLRRFKIFGGVTAAAFLIGGVWWLLTRNQETTDDAFIEADMVQIAPQVGGIVAAVHFTDNQRVAAGAPLIDIDPADLEALRAAAEAGLNVALAQEQAAQADLDLIKATTGAAVDEARHAVDQARHQVAEARETADAANADSIRAAADVKRYQDLLQRADASRQRVEQAIAEARSTGARWRAAQLAVTAAASAQAQTEARYRDALAAPQRIAQKEAQLANSRAQIAQALANLQTARLSLSYVHIVAPKAGRIGRRAVNAGDVVQKGQILANLVVDPPWVIANFKETQLTRMHPGQPVAITVDAFPGHRLEGRVDSVQPGSGARFSLLPPENATGNYVKVVQRFPVKILFADAPDDLLRQLSPGMSVVPEVDVSSRQEAPR
ncbi:HlyD family secretion protein [Telmatospirillum siberiense]|nr:HlyD family secretion protein [Telmatospirillum siberiense]